MIDIYFNESYSLAHILLARGIAALYLLAFIGAFNQFPALLGEKGLLPAPDFLKRVPFSKTPSIFHFYYSDHFFLAVSAFGALLSLLFLVGAMSFIPLWGWILSWTVLWLLYLSIVSVGQRFYSFGWESMMIEAGFFATFLAPGWLEASLIPIILMRWMLFRVEVGAGLIKLRGDPCWRSLTCLIYHHETQPLPNPLSRFFHFSPAWIHKSGVVFSHFVQIVAPFGLFFPQPVAGISGALIIFHQLLLIISGNYAWLNWITVVLGFSAFSDTQLPFPFLSPLNSSVEIIWNQWLLYIATAVTAVLSIKPALNLISKNQLMNYCYNSLHLVNTYGAFGSVTKKRYEVILEGTQDAVINAYTYWQEYEFKAKPGDVTKRPPQVAPYHLRLDWLMWFLPLGVNVRGGKVLVYGYEQWFVNLLRQLLRAEPAILKLIKSSPFGERPPTYIRASFYLYQFTTPKEAKETRGHWKRTYVGEYLPPVSLNYLESI